MGPRDGNSVLSRLATVLTNEATDDCLLVVTLDNVQIVSADAKILLSNAAASVSPPESSWDDICTPKM